MSKALKFGNFSKSHIGNGKGVMIEEDSTVPKGGRLVNTLLIYLVRAMTPWPGLGVTLRNNAENLPSIEI